jgi:hypothetical protein
MAVRTRSHALSSVESWPLVGTLKEVRIPARPRSRGDADHEVTRFRPVGYTTQALTPPETPTRASCSPTTSNAPSQLSALTKVFDAVRLYAEPDLLILHILWKTIQDFITNYGVDGWSPTKPHSRIDRGVVSRVLSEVHRTAHEMADGDGDVEILEHATRWAVLMFEKRTLNVKGWKKEGGSEIYLGMREFVRWMEQEC